MKKYFAQLRPLERRVAVGVLVLLFLVLNGVFIYPHFADWARLRGRMTAAEEKLKLFQAGILQTPTYEAEVKGLQSHGEFVEDMSVNMLRTVQTQSAQSGVQLQISSPQTTHANDAFFVEQLQNINVIADDKQLVDFLYRLGSGASMIRVRDLVLQPDAPRQHLVAQIQLVASYPKNAPAGNLKPANAKAK